MNFTTLARDLWLLTNFRNGWEMLWTLRGYPSPCHARLINGKTIVHPSQKAGLVEAILEVWFEKIYLPKDFYVPNSGDVIVDVGANIGLFAIQIARLNSDSRIAAFEPFPENFACLSKNVSKFCYAGKISLHQCAISDSYGTEAIVDTGHRSLDHQLIKNSKSYSDVANSIPVNVIPLEGIFEIVEADEISLLKMDIEGSEQEVFKSTSEKTLKRLRRVVIEYHDHLRSGTLALIKEKLTTTHQIRIIPSNLSGCGLLFAMRKV